MQHFEQLLDMVPSQCTYSIPMFVAFANMKCVKTFMPFEILVALRQAHQIDGEYTAFFFKPQPQVTPKP